MDWTILRPGGFDSNTGAWAETIRRQRTAAAPFGDIGLPFIDPADIGEVAAAALREDGHAGQAYELTGPALSTPRQRAEAIGDALGELRPTRGSLSPLPGRLLLKPLKCLDGCGGGGSGPCVLRMAAL
jgi:uncharacterized protein YbjT (DUF2867 family)